jgi:hypothetical protein
MFRRTTYDAQTALGLFFVFVFVFLPVDYFVTKPKAAAGVKNSVIRLFISLLE